VTDPEAGYALAERRFRLSFEGGEGGASVKTVEWTVRDNAPQEEGGHTTTSIHLVHTKQ
jgi:hypothetical protein